MSFASNVENDLRSILGGEFSVSSISIQVGSLSYDKDDVGGIYDRTFLEVDDDGAPIQSSMSQVGIYVKTIDDELGHELSEDDSPTIVVDGDTFYLDHIQRDGTGYGRLILKKR